MKLTQKKLAQLKADAEHKKTLWAGGLMGNAKYVFVNPNDLLELLRRYPSP
jgi:hypothetical protein